MVSGSEPANARDASDGARPETPAAPGKSARDGGNPFVQHAEKAGIEACSGIYAGLGQGLTSGADYAVQSFWTEQKPDAHAVEGLVGLTYKSKSFNGPAAGYVYAAPTRDGCEGTMVRVAPFKLSCDKTVSALPEGSKRINELGQVTVYALGNGGRAMLLPTGSSCAVVSIVSAKQSAETAQGDRK